MNKAEHYRFKESFVSGQRGEVKGCDEMSIILSKVCGGVESKMCTGAIKKAQKEGTNKPR